jgi:HlyD family secretion protein
MQSVLMNSDFETLMASQPDPLQRKQPPSQRSGRKKWDALLKMMPGTLLLAFVITLGLLFGEHLIPSVRVQTVTPVVMIADAREEASVPIPDSGTPNTQALFQSSGWIEADPFPYRAYSLASGVIDRVLVLEGDRVEKGQLLVSLNDEDALLAVQASESQLARAEAELQAIEFEREGLDHQLQVAIAQAAVQQSRAEELRDIVQRLEQLTNAAVPEQEITQSRLRLATQTAMLESAIAAVMPINSQIRRGEARIQSQKAAVDYARNELAKARLNLQRMTIESPISGIVQKLTAAPGQKKMLSSDMPDSHVVALLFDPNNLQARIDVPLEEASKLAIGQPVRIRTSLLPQTTFEGRVIRIVGEADLQRNTLQAKIRILNPDPSLRPDMLCRAEFFPKHESSTSNREGSRANSRLLLHLPKAAIDRRDATTRVWRVSSDRKRAEAVQVQTSEAENPDFVLIRAGISPGDPIIINPSAKLTHNARIKITNTNQENRLP